jgi:hypothetical protein
MLNDDGRKMLADYRARTLALLENVDAAIVTAARCPALVGQQFVLLLERDPGDAVGETPGGDAYCLVPTGRGPSGLLHVLHWSEPHARDVAKRWNAQVDPDLSVHVVHMRDARQLRRAQLAAILADIDGVLAEPPA